MKKTLSIILAVGLIISLQGNVALANTGIVSDQNGSLSNYEETLEKSGFDTKIIAIMNNDTKKKIAESKLKDPSSVEVVKTILSIDNLAIFEYYTNTEDSDLLKNGINPDEIKKIRNRLNELNSLTKEQFKDKHSSSDEEYKMIKKALTKNKNYKTKNLNNIVTTSGDISSSKLYYNMGKVNNSASGPSYNIYIGYQWYQCYFNDIFTDSVAVAWGGGLNVKNVSATADYYYGNYFTGWTSGGLYGKYNWSKQETPQLGIVFNSPQSKTNAFGSEAQNKNGWIEMDLYQTKYQGYDTNVVSQFCHKVLALSGGSVSLGKGAGYATINVTTNYDNSPQSSMAIQY